VSTRCPRPPHIVSDLEQSLPYSLHKCSRIHAGLDGWWSVVAGPNGPNFSLWNKRLRDRAPLGTPENIRNHAVFSVANLLTTA
jgi:hypothetical protein